MSRNDRIRKIVFFAVMLIALLSLAVFASAEGTNPCSGTQHKGPYSYRNRVNATCTVNGRQDKYCDACGQYVGTEPIIAIGHQYESSTMITQEPKCLTAGAKQISTICKVCGDIKDVKKEEIPALGHDWGDWQVTTAATCTAAGVETRVCRRDSSHVETRPISAIGHNYGDWLRTKQPTCEQPGEDTRTCKNDPSHKETRPVDPIGHLWDSGKVTRQPDCTYPGVRTYTCQRDASHIRTESIPIEPDAHKWDSGKVTKAPTCTTPGVRTYTCTINPQHTKTESIPIDPDAHDWGPRTVVKAATCTEPGTAQIVCRLDPSHVKTETIPPTGHEWDKGTVIKKPTLTEEGEKLYVCQHDPSHTKTEKIPKQTMSNNTICAFGPRLRDTSSLYPYNTDLWYMFTPFDASKNGKQTYELVASNMYIVGTLTMEITDGVLVVDYTLNSNTINITLEFFTVLSRIQDINKYEPEDLLYLNMRVKQPINLTDLFGEDTNLVLYFCSRCDYTYSNRFIGLNYNSTAHQRLLTTMRSLMD